MKRIKRTLVSLFCIDKEARTGAIISRIGKLYFEVTDKESLAPVPGASIEIWIPSSHDGEGACVLLGLTSEAGILELDVAFNTKKSKNKLGSADGKVIFKGSLLYLPSEHLKYRAYKAGWLPDVYEGDVILEAHKTPQTVKIPLLQKRGGSYDSPGWLGEPVGEEDGWDGPAPDPDKPIFLIHETNEKNDNVF